MDRILLVDLGIAIGKKKRIIIICVVTGKFIRTSKASSLPSMLALSRRSKRKRSLCMFLKPVSLAGSLERNIILLVVQCSELALRDVSSRRFSHFGQASDKGMYR